MNPLSIISPPTDRLSPLRHLLPLSDIPYDRGQQRKGQNTKSICWVLSLTCLTIFLIKYLFALDSRSLSVQSTDQLLPRHRLPPLANIAPNPGKPKMVRILSIDWFPSTSRQTISQLICCFSLDLRSLILQPAHRLISRRPLRPHDKIAADHLCKNLGKKPSCIDDFFHAPHITFFQFN